ncbi:hypothetical protein BaRGS_00013971 [Batillaria attramentaria]|uniref:Secreted protein n=1 Tax=Batillaria attramentaria TaxID=370345 RepID=A0ABD0L714_9CAEN
MFVVVFGVFLICYTPTSSSTPCNASHPSPSSNNVNNACLMLVLAQLAAQRAHLPCSQRRVSRGLHQVVSPWAGIVPSRQLHGTRLLDHLWAQDLGQKCQLCHSSYKYLLFALCSVEMVGEK